MKFAFFSGEHSHDDVRALARHLRSHSKGQDHRVLFAFLQDVTAALKEEIRNLPHTVQALVPSWNNILDLVEHSSSLQGGPLAEPVERTLLCVLKLGALIGHYELDPDTFDFHQSGSCLLGLGVGVPVAAAVSLCPTIWDLPARGAEVVRIVFRCAFHVDRVARMLDTFDPESPSTNWIYVILNSTEEAVREHLHAAQQSNQTPNPGKIFICNARPHGISICGPPSRLQRLFGEDEFFQKSNHIRMPCHGGPIHAEHIFDQGDVAKIVHQTRSNRSSNAQVISPGTGRPFPASDSTELFTQIINYLLTEQVCWEKEVKYAVEWAEEHGRDYYQIFSFRPSQQVQDVVNAVQTELKQVKISTVDWLQWVFTPPGTPPTTRSAGPLQSNIAIVGMSCRFPGGADDTDKYWDLLASGRDVHREIPPDRFDLQSHFDPTGQTTNATHTPWGCFVENPGLFEPSFFNMSPREAEQTDPMQRLALITAYEALEKAGFVAHKSIDMHRVGTFYGQSSDDYREVNSGQDIGTYWISGGCRAFGPGRINYFFGFGGPSFSCDTACSSSLATIQMACTSLWSGETDMVVAGGMNILSNPDVYAGLSKAFFLSHTGNCKTWDRGADGYCRADGVGSVVMKRLDDAIADNDNILGVVRAAATNHSAEAISITHPHAGAQSYLFRQVAGQAGLDPLDVGYVELHGTGTQAGDSVELSSVTEVFAPGQQGRNAHQPLYIGAAKANVGHGEAAAGIMALIKTLCVIQKETIPPHVGIKNDLTPHFPSDADKRRVLIPYHETPWKRSPEKKRIAIVNNFGAAGGNTTFVIEEGPQKPAATMPDPRDTHALMVSAKSVASLQQNIDRLLSYLRKNPHVALHDLAYSLTARRSHYAYRVGFAVSAITDFERLCAPYLDEEPSLQPVRRHPPPVVFTFTGQGSFYSSMATQLFKDSATFRNHILHFNALAQRQGFESFVPVIDGSPESTKFSLVVTHLAIVCVEMALSDFWQQLGLKPSIVIGHSIGEVVALYAAGVLCANDVIFLVGQRATLLDRLTELGTYGMLATRATLDKAKKIAESTGCDVACINGPEDIILAGRTEALSSASERLKEDGIKTLMLDLGYGYHSRQMDSILDEYERVVEGIVFHKPIIPVISPLLSTVVREKGTLNASYMKRAMREAVDFVGSLQNAKESNLVNDRTIWLELGPHPLCCAFIRNTLGKQAGLTVPSIRKKEDNWATLSQTLCELHCAGIEIDWKEYHGPFEKALRLLDLPTYAWDDKNYWIPYSGNWSLLKGRASGTESNSAASEPALSALPPELQTSSIHGVLEKHLDEQVVKLVVETNILDPQIAGAVNGHAINGYGVVSCMTHGEIAYAMAEYLYKQVKSEEIGVNMNLCNFEYHEPVTARKSTEQKQLIHTEATWETTSSTIQFRFQNVESEQWYCHASIMFEDSNAWLADWSRTSHLINSRIECLREAADSGLANKLSHQMAYRLFANLMDWSEPFKGMESVVLDRMEAVADVKLSMDDRGQWYIPPWYMESLITLSGFVLNGTEVMDNKRNFFITPGFKTMRFATPLKAGEHYQCYVKMLPMGPANMYAGDVYILQGSAIVGVMEKIMYRQWPRAMLNRFFVPPDAKKAISAGATPHDTRPDGGQPKSEHPGRNDRARSLSGGSSSTNLEDSSGDSDASTANTEQSVNNGLPPPKTRDAPKVRANESVPVRKERSSLTSRALAVIADEAALDVNDLDESAEFGDLGIDSLMSLVLAQKFRSEIGVEVRDSIFIEFPVVRDLCQWLERQ